MQHPFGPGHGDFVDPVRLRSEKRLRTLGTVQLVFAALGAMGLVNALVQKSDRNPLTRKFIEAMWSGTMGTWMTISLVLSAVLSTLLAAAGYSMLKRRPLARSLTLAHGVAAIVVNIVSTYFTFTFLMPAMADLGRELGPAADVFKTAMTGGLAFGVAMGLAFPVIEIYMVTRPLARDILSASSAERAPT